MENNLLFEFTLDKTTKTVLIIREFNAPQALVWEAFTTAELLDQWVAPKPFTSRTKYMEFKEGGKRFYAMVSPEGDERWALQEYKTIRPTTYFKMYNAFADKDENPELPGSEWDYQFSEQNARIHNLVSRPITKVVITIYNESFERMEKLLEGFQQGYTMTLNMLEHLLTDLSKPQLK